MSMNPFVEAQDLLRTHGWRQFGQEAAPGAMCIEQAACGNHFGASAKSSEALSLLRSVLTEQYPECVMRGAGEVIAWCWNDAHNRTFDEVESVLEKCAVLWDEKHGLS